MSLASTRPTPVQNDLLRRRLFDTLLATRIGLHHRLDDPLGAITGGGEADRIRRLVAATRATEIDDIHIAGCVTAGAVIVPIALVASASRGVGLGHMLAAMAAGYEAMIAFSAAIEGPSILYRGFWPTYLAAPLGAAAVVAHLHGLDAAATAQALRLAIGRTAWWLDPAAPRWLSLGCAAVEGMVAAKAAAAGVTAGDALLEHWLERAGLEIVPEVLARSGEEKWLETIDGKTFPTSRQGLAAIKSFHDLQVRHPGRSIARVDVAVPSAYLKMVGNGAPPGNRIDSMLSVAWQMAFSAFAPERLYDVRRADIPDEEPFSGFVRAVTLSAAEDLSRAFPDVWGGRVRIDFVDGGSDVVERRSGAGDEALDWSALDMKARALASPNGLVLDDLLALRDRCRTMAQDAVFQLSDALPAIDAS